MEHFPDKINLLLDAFTRLAKFVHLSLRLCLFFPTSLHMSQQNLLNLKTLFYLKNELSKCLSHSMLLCNVLIISFVRIGFNHLEFTPNLIP